MGVDWGEKRIGLAVSDPRQVLAQPLATLTRRPGRRFPMQELRRHMTALDAFPVGVVVGLPLTSEGDEGPAAREARAMGSLIAEKIGLPVAYVDERFTTSRALQAVAELGGRPRKRPGVVDRLAATVLLQSYLDRSRR